MKKIMISQESDPYFNIAAEHQLFLASEEDIHLFLWQNDASVIIGRNQNLYAECDLDYLKEHRIHPVRRFSGGGAVYHDKGNVNFTFITKEKNAYQEEFIGLIQAAMSKLGIDCEFSGRNDLLVDGRKFSGHAYYTDNGNYMYHGTILVNVNFEQLKNALTPSKLKLSSKGIESVKSRVLNLSEMDSKITAEKVLQAFIEAFGSSPIEYINKTNTEAPLAQLLSSYDWVYGQSPKFDLQLERSYPFGNVAAYLSVSDGFIQDVKISTDSLHLYDFKSCEDELKGKCFSEQIVWECVERCISHPLAFL
jgi:lipoate-protein ligase A